MIEVELEAGYNQVERAVARRFDRGEGQQDDSQQPELLLKIAALVVELGIAFNTIIHPILAILALFRAVLLTNCETAVFVLKAVV